MTTGSASSRTCDVSFLSLYIGCPAVDPCLALLFVVMLTRLLTPGDSLPCNQTEAEHSNQELKVCEVKTSFADGSAYARQLLKVQAQTALNE